MQILINEAIAHAKASGRKVLKSDIARAIWPNCCPKAQCVYMSKLLRGGFKTFRAEWIPIICEKTGVTPNFLFNFNPAENHENDK